MIVYRVSGEGLLRLVTLAAAAPDADVDTILGIVRGADVEESEPAHDPAPAMPDVAAGPDLDADADGDPVKPAKPE